ncbi:MAG TPA: shikimate dehydrogenase [Candidatus Eremiobacteraceae bacterium]|nr:shikimate dehydrogenase [Candidatus Eremiobacteraceae bacterium]
MSAAYALIGDPVEHSLSPVMQNAALRATGIDASYEAIRVPPEDLTSFIGMARSGSVDGFNVTTPLKEQVLGYLDDAGESAREAGAANAVRRDGDRLTGHNTDGDGLVAALADLWQWDPRGANALVLGSGPAARAFARALKRAGAVAISCWSRNAQTASAIGPPPRRPVDLAVSALPHDAVVPDEILESIDAHTSLFDANYGAPRSPFPPRIGARRADGLALLLHQGALSFEWWTGRPAPLEIMRRAIGF